MKLNTVRLEAISDGIIAIIITIMVLELKLPDISNDDSTREVFGHLRHLLPYFISYSFSFMMITILWNNHHHLFSVLEKTDQRLLWQNFMFLFFLSLIPFATALVGSNHRVPIAPVMYSTVMMLTTLSFAIMRHHSLKKRLTHHDEDKELTREIAKVSLKSRRKAFIATLIYLIAIPIAFVNVYLAYACFAVPPVIFFIPDGLDDEKLAGKVDEKNK